MVRVMEFCGVVGVDGVDEVVGEFFGRDVFYFDVVVI